HADHPLQPDPAARHPRLRACPRGLPGCRAGRPGAGRTARGRGLRAAPHSGLSMSTTAEHTLTAAELAAFSADFALLERTVRDGRPVVYLDSAATSQKPECVIDAEQDFYLRRNAAVHRGAHALAEEATTAYEEARETVATFVGVDAD